MVAECFKATLPSRHSNTADMAGAANTVTSDAGLPGAESNVDEGENHHASSSEWESVSSSPESVQEPIQPNAHIHSRVESEKLRPQNPNNKKRKRSRSSRRDHNLSTDREMPEKKESNSVQSRRTQHRSPTRPEIRHDAAHVRGDPNTSRSNSAMEHREGFQAKDSINRGNGSQGRLMAMMQKVAKGSSQKQ
jgi:hypothetical protein